MEPLLLIPILTWLTLINMGILVYWFLMFVFAHDFMYNLHRRWFRLTAEQFDILHYALMSFYKILILAFNLVPLVVIEILILYRS